MKIRKYVELKDNIHHIKNWGIKPMLCFGKKFVHFKMTPNDLKKQKQNGDLGIIYRLNCVPLK
jgi:hypothetical protein